jgi:hypothetical protein
VLVIIDVSHDLQTHLNLRIDFTGSFDRILNSMSSGRTWRIGGCRLSSLVWNIFHRNHRRERELGLKNVTQA